MKGVITFNGLSNKSLPEECLVSGIRPTKSTSSTWQKGTVKDHKWTRLYSVCVDTEQKGGCEMLPQTGRNGEYIEEGSIKIR